MDGISCCPRCLSLKNNNKSRTSLANNELGRQGGENGGEGDGEKEKEGEGEDEGNRNVITNRSSHSEGKRHCVSDDSHKEYSHGDSWKVISIYGERTIS